MARDTVRIYLKAESPPTKKLSQNMAQAPNRHSRESGNPENRAVVSEIGGFEIVSKKLTRQGRGPGRIASGHRLSQGTYSLFN